MDKRFLFVSGCPRSGTTAFTRLLNGHPYVAIGIERYRLLTNRRPESLTPALFDKERFFEIKESDTTVKAHRDYERLQRKWDSARIVGDKNPRYFLMYKRILEAFPQCKIAYLVRNIQPVASSWNARASNPSDRWPGTNDYKPAVELWNKANKVSLEWIENHPDQIVAVNYESIFSGNKKHLERVLEGLEINPHPKLIAKFEAMTANWQERVSKPHQLTDEQRSYISINADVATYSRLVSIAAVGARQPLIAI